MYPATSALPPPLGRRFPGDSTSPIEGEYLGVTGLARQHARIHAEPA
jgi:hypothetical protein